MNVIIKWIRRRALDDLPVSIPEIVDAVLTTQWTPSPSTWKLIFEKVVASEGLSIDGGEVKQHWEHDVSLTVQYLKTMIACTGGVGKECS